MSTLLLIGRGYTATRFARAVAGRFTRIIGTRRKVSAPEPGIETLAFDGTQEPSAALLAACREASAILVSAPPERDGTDPALAALGGAIESGGPQSWIGYLSTTGVYGDRGGALVDAGMAPSPQSAGSRARLAAEEGWRALGARSGTPVAVFRISGIYGPGRNPLRRLADGDQTRVIKPGHVFNRIHVDDIVGALALSLAAPTAGPVFDLADDAPTPGEVPIEFAASLLGIAPPPAVMFDAAAMSPMAAGFYAESRRVSNRIAREALGWRPRYPSYREGLAALHAAGEGTPQAR